MTKKIAVIVGSLRKDSFSRKIANILIKMAPNDLSMKMVEINKLSFFNQDEEATPPAAWVSFREEIKKVDAILFVTPEYNRSIPGVLKNAIDVGSRPYGQSVWEGKPCAVISVTPGSTGAFGSNHHLRQCFVFLNMPCMQQPEAYLGNVTSYLNEDGSISSESTQEFLKKFIQAFSAWVHK